MTIRACIIVSMAFIMALTGRTAVINVSQGTNLTVAYDVTGNIVVTDLLGGLWQLPGSGGGAFALIPAGSGVAQPRFDPAGTRVVFQRMIDGQWDLWLLDLASREWSALTETPYNEMEPDFTPDGEGVIFASNRSGRYALWQLDLDDDGLRQLTDDPGDSHFPTASVGNEIVYVNRYNNQSTLRRYTGRMRGDEMLRVQTTLDAPSVRPGGSVVVLNERNASESSELRLFIDADEPLYRPLTAGEDVFVGRIAWISEAAYLYAADGAIWRREIGATERSAVHLFAAADLPATESATIVSALDEPGPRPARGIRDYAPSPDSRRAAIAALGDLWLVDEDGTTQFTNDAFVDIQPQFTPDGEVLVFVSDRTGKLELWQQRIDSSAAVQLSNETGSVFSPVLSPDGKFAAFLVVSGPIPMAETELRLLQLDRPYRSEVLADRLFDVGELRWNSGELTFIARDGARDAPRSERALPIARGSNASLVAEAAPPPTTSRYEPELSFEQMAGDASYVVQVDRLFDGVGNDYMRNVDIHVDGARISAVVPRGQLPLPDRVLSGQTAVPGFIDVHAHHSALAGGRLGRMWLGHGVTTVREVDADLAAASERAESWASGRRLGPRLVIAPGLGTPAAAHETAPPIIIHSASRISPGFAHAVAAGAPVSTAASLSLSALNRSYDDVIERIVATGSFVSTGFAASGLEPLTAFADTLNQIAQRSSRIAIGSDAPAVPYGLGLHLELERLAEQGIPNAQALRWATAGGALALGLVHELGTLEAGKLADFVIINGDPLARIEDSRKIDAVVKGGIWFEPEKLLGSPEI